MNRTLDCGIVGCGIAGTAAALMLAGQGHRVTLFEQTDHVGPVGAGVLLQPSGQRVLAEMGLLDALLPKVEPIDQIHAVTETGRDLVRLQYGEFHPGVTGAGLHRGDLFSLLHGQLESAGVRLMLDTKIVRLRDIEHRPTAVDARGQSHGPFDLVIAANGSRSVLRESAGLHAHVIEYDYGALWTVADVAPVRRQLFQIAHGTQQLMGLLPVGGGRCSLFWGMHRNAIDALHRRGFGRWRDDVLRLAPIAEPLLDRIRSFDATRFVTYRHVHLRRSWRGNVVFIGDAVHAMSPHLGQGVNLALQDAQSLSLAIREETSVQTAFRRHSLNRRWSIAYYAGVTAFLTPFFQSNSRLLGIGRNLALPVLCRCRPTRRMMLRTLCGKDAGQMPINPAAHVP
ncbi:FAD-dependent oxidoreductase [Humisphaera borealis]|uniref:FAD-dependent monooxygenase n=1 Tax=Humisphaera borealis TaxID=2807512 RepID=A0A7M2X208_9BACT|nr:NAD(P)/FAD-dependent oxidoreductase [Humisphaera borealis]QOV91743.1 FAD-dependent monooxygenase [Humisphaera borealis]